MTHINGELALEEYPTLPQAARPEDGPDYDAPLIDGLSCYTVTEDVGPWFDRRKAEGAARAALKARGGRLLADSIPCPDCPLDILEDCGTCMGIGRVSQASDASTGADLIETVADTETDRAARAGAPIRCWDCDGTGEDQLFGGTCAPCSGTGKRSVEEAIADDPEGDGSPEHDLDDHLRDLYWDAIFEEQNQATAVLI